MADIMEIMARAMCAEGGAWEPDEKACGTSAWELYAGEATAALSALSAAGYVVVPKEPTEAMLKAGAAYTGGDYARVQWIIEDMLAAVSSLGYSSQGGAHDVD